MLGKGTERSILLMEPLPLVQVNCHSFYSTLQEHIINMVSLTWKRKRKRKENVRDYIKKSVHF